MIAKIREKVGFGWIFLSAVILIYLIVLFFNENLFWKSLDGFVKIILNILPILVLVFVLIFIVNLLLEPKTMMKYLGHGSGAKGWLIAMLAGVISTGPIYMWYPLLADLKEHGMKTSLIAAFLYCRAVKIPLLPLMIFYFGWVFTIVLNVYLFIFSVVNGFIVGKFSEVKK